MAKRKGKCAEEPKRSGPMTVTVKPYKRKDGTKIPGHRRHKPK